MLLYFNQGHVTPQAFIQDCALRDDWLSELPDSLTLLLHLKLLYRIA